MSTQLLSCAPGHRCLSLTLPTITASGRCSHNHAVENQYKRKKYIKCYQSCVILIIYCSRLLWFSTRLKRPESDIHNDLFSCRGARCASSTSQRVDRQPRRRAR